MKLGLQAVPPHGAAPTPLPFTLSSESCHLAPWFWPEFNPLPFGTPLPPFRAAQGIMNQLNKIDNALNIDKFIAVDGPPIQGGALNCDKFIKMIKIKGGGLILNGAAFCDEPSPGNGAVASPPASSPPPVSVSSYSSLSFGREEGSDGAVSGGRPHVETNEDITMNENIKAKAKIKKNEKNEINMEGGGGGGEGPRPVAAPRPVARRNRLAPTPGRIMKLYRALLRARGFPSSGHFG